MIFTSDNAAPAAPEVLAAMLAANEGHAASYGNDDIMARVTARIREIFEAPEAAVYLVPTGTAANALALATICPPWATVYCATHAHIAEEVAQHSAYDDSPWEPSVENDQFLRFLFRIDSRNERVNGSFHKTVRNTD